MIAADLSFKFGAHSHDNVAGYAGLTVGNWCHIGLLNKLIILLLLSQAILQILRNVDSGGEINNLNLVTLREDEDDHGAEEKGDDTPGGHHVIVESSGDLQAVVE